MKVDGNESITTGENDDAGQQLYFRGLSRSESTVIAQSAEYRPDALSSEG